ALRWMQRHVNAPPSRRKRNRWRGRAVPLLFIRIFTAPPVTDGGKALRRRQLTHPQTILEIHGNPRRLVGLPNGGNILIGFARFPDPLHFFRCQVFPEGFREGWAVLRPIVNSHWQERVFSG